MGKKKCAVFTGKGKPFDIREYDVTPPAAGQVGLNLIASGICGTDVHIHQGFLAMPDFPLIIGHEFTGRIDALGDGATTDALGQPLKVGAAAIACVAIPCGKCFNCKRGETASCLSFGVTYVKNVDDAPHFHGGYAEYLFSPAENLAVIPDGVDPVAAAAFPCGGPTIIRACTYGGGLEQGELVVIQGNGPLGIFALAWAKAAGCRTAVIGSTGNAHRLEMTMELKPDLFFDFRKVTAEEIGAKIREFAASLGRGDGADVVIETSGSHDAVPLGLTLLRTRGRYFVPGQYSARGPISINPEMITFRALQIIGSGQYTMADLGTYLKFLKDNPDIQAFFRKSINEYRIEDADKAFEDAIAGRAVKAMFTA